MAKLDVRNLGDYIREQRSAAQISLRQLASLAGVSNPYLSQIERGLRKPSAEILQQIAKALRISAEALYVQAGILEERYGDSDVPAAILGDAYLAERQKQVLLELYEAYRRESDVKSGTAEKADSESAPTPTSRTRTARRAKPRAAAAGGADTDENQAASS
ncbi:MAG TPA: helix-turn-helix transcriptional regulator [Mycobacteriales bacterium]|nr:helix-turn-helix transcriptional regulator [Mycobacteriales bacterium]